MRHDYDLVILGGGIAGAVLALVASKLPCKVLVLERGRHPRFAIGESTIPSTTFGFRYLSRTYGVPELEEVSHYLGLRKLGLRGYPKRHFWFGIHREDNVLKQEDQLLFETFALPNGPDIHMLREDVDAFLVSRLEHYAIDYWDLSELTHFEKTPQGVRLEVKAPTGLQHISARLVVDAAGHQSFFARKFNLRYPPKSMRTQSRAIFGHFRGLQKLDQTIGDNPFRYNREAGTMHHCFRGGWIWVIPFDHEVTSVGFMLNPEIFPLDQAQSPEDEMQALLARFPSISAHLGSMVPARPIIRSGPVQFHSRDIVGDGFVLTPHASAFVEPLFSSGLLLTQMFVMRFVPRLGEFLKTGDSSVFASLNAAFGKEIETIDTMVSGMVKSFDDRELFRQFWRVWVHGTALQYFGLTSGNPADPDGLALAYGAAFPQWRKTLARMHETVCDDARTVEDRVAQMKAIMDQVPHPFAKQRFKPHLAGALQIHPDMDLLRQLKWGASTIAAMPHPERWQMFHRFGRYIVTDVWRRSRFSLKYALSRMLRTEFHREVAALEQLSAKQPPLVPKKSGEALVQS